MWERVARKEMDCREEKERKRGGITKKRRGFTREGKVL